MLVPPDKLDLLFPLFVFAYGTLLTFVLHAPPLANLVESRLPYAVAKQVKAHRALGIVCLVLGAVWSLQNLWL